MQIASAPKHTPEHTSSESLWDTLAHFIAGAIAMFGDAKALAERLLLSRKEYRIACAWLSRCEDLLRRLIFIDAVKLLANARPLTLTRPEIPKLRHSGRAERDPEPRGNQRGCRSWVPGSASPPRSDGGCTTSESRNRVTAETQARGAKDGPCCDPTNPAAWRAPFALIPRGGGSRGGGRGGLYKSEPRELGEFIDPDESRDRALVLAAQHRLLFTPALAPDRRVAPANTELRQAATALVSSHTLALRLEALMRAGQNPVRHAERLARWLARDRARAALFTRPTRSFYSLKRQPADHAVADATHFARAAWAQCDSS